MATTLTGIITTKDTGYIFHVGNMRGYWLQGSYLKQFTEDQTTYQWLLNTGQADIAETCNKNEIIYCLGGGNNKYASGLQIMQSDTLALCKRIILTTDGIHEFVTIDELEDFILGELNDKTMQELAEKASSNGSLDDKTIVVIDKM